MSSQQQDIINRMQMKDTVRLFNEMTETCFQTCVKDFMQKQLNGAEDECIENVRRVFSIKTCRYEIC